MEEKYLDFLKNQKLFSGLTPEEIEVFGSHAIVEEYPPDVTLIHEEDTSNEIYMIFDGEVTLLKWDEEKKYQLEIGKLHQGSLIGEMSFIDKEPRSSSVVTSENTTVIKFCMDTFKKSDPQLRSIYDAVLYNSAESSIVRLRTTNRNYVRSLRLQIDFGYFFIVSLSIFACGNFFILLSTNYGVNPQSTTFSWSYILALLFLFIWLASHFKYSLQDMGVTVLNWRQSVREGLIISFIFIGCMLTGYLIYAKIHHLTEPILDVILYPKNPFDISAFFYFFYVYIQGFMARGVAQTSLQRFLKDDSGMQTVLITSIMLSLLYVYQGVVAVGITFVANLFLGYVYFRHRNLLGVAIIQYVIAIIFNSYLGVI